MFKQKPLLGLICLLWPFCITTELKAQSDERSQNSANETTFLSKKELRKMRPAYICTGAGFNAINLRDFATSPLVYRGLARTFSLAYLKADDIRETELGFLTSKGNLVSSVNKYTTLAQIQREDLYFSKLYKISALSGGKFTTKVGGLFNGTFNLRTNSKLQNNAIGIEIIATFFASIKVTKDISRKEDQHKKFLFVKYTLKEKKRNLAFRLNIGILNNIWRNGYIYTNHAAVLNNGKLLSGYELYSGGFRMGTSLDYTTYLKNKNAIQLSYVWDAYQTGSKFDKLELASHSFKISLMFNTNNK